MLTSVRTGAVLAALAALCALGAGAASAAPADTVRHTAAGIGWDGADGAATSLPTPPSNGIGWD